MLNLNSIRRIIRNREALIKGMFLQRVGNELEIRNLNDLIKCYNTQLSKGEVPAGEQREIVKEQLRDFIHYRKYLIGENERLTMTIRVHRGQINNEVIRINWAQTQHFKAKALCKKGSTE